MTEEDKRLESGFWNDAILEETLDPATAIRLKASRKKKRISAAGAMAVFAAVIAGMFAFLQPGVRDNTRFRTQIYQGSGEEQSDIERFISEGCYTEEGVYSDKAGKEVYPFGEEGSDAAQAYVYKKTEIWLISDGASAEVRREPRFDIYYAADGSGKTVSLDARTGDTVAFFHPGIGSPAGPFRYLSEDEWIKLADGYLDLLLPKARMQGYRVKKTAENGSLITVTYERIVSGYLEGQLIAVTVGENGMLYGLNAKGYRAFRDVEWRLSPLRLAHAESCLFRKLNSFGLKELAVTRTELVRDASGDVYLAMSYTCENNPGEAGTLYYRVLRGGNRYRHRYYQ